MDIQELIAQLKSLVNQTKGCPEREVAAASVVLHALLASLLDGTTMRLAGSAAAFCQLAIADAADPKLR